MSTAVRQRAVGSLFLAAALLAGAGRAAAQGAAPIVLGRIGTQGEVSFTRSPAGGWGIRIANPGRASMVQAAPLILRTIVDSTRRSEQAGGYASVRRDGAAVIGGGELAPAPGVTVRFEDRWSIAGAVLNLERRVAVRGSAPGGFNSGFRQSPERHHLAQVFDPALFRELATAPARHGGDSAAERGRPEAVRPDKQAPAGARKVTTTSR